MKFSVLAIDPSINTLGYAVLVVDDATLKAELVGYDTIKALKATQKLVLEERMKLILDDLMLSFEKRSFDYTVIEKPESWGAYKSMASQHSGGLLLLHILVGALWQWSRAVTVESHSFLVKVSEWKGQLPKKLTQERMEMKYSVKFNTDHESDATGLGDWFICNRLIKEGKLNAD